MTALRTAASKLGHLSCARRLTRSYARSKASDRLVLSRATIDAEQRAGDPAAHIAGK